MALTLHLFDNFEKAVHSGDINCASDTFKLVISNTAMNRAWTQLSQVTQIANGNGYTTGGAAVTIASLSQTAGVLGWVGSTVTWTASSAGISGRYFALYSDTSTDNLLVGWWDYGSTFTVNAGRDLDFMLSLILSVITTA